MKNKMEYIRDGRSPIPSSGSVSKVMSSNKGKDTQPELILRRALRAEGIRGYRLHWKKVPGRPDISFPGKKLAIFVNGCFWHRCPVCDLPLPKSNIGFWVEKFSRNKERDKKKIHQLESSGWSVITIWECQIRNNVLDCVKKVENLLV